MNQHHGLFLKWLILAVLIIFGAGAAIYFNLIQIIILNDISMISAGIIAIFICMFVYLGFRTSQVSKELNLASQVEGIIEKHEFEKLEFVIDKNDLVYVCGEQLPECQLTSHIGNLITKARIASRGEVNQRILLEEFSDSIHDKNSLGWMVSQKMVNLGLLGTAIGFAVALQSLFGINSFDFSAMKTILSEVAVGMSIALYTTITALATSIPLEIKSYFIEKGNNQLVSMATKVTEIYVIPVLERDYVSEPVKK